MRDGRAGSKKSSVKEVIAYLAADLFLGDREIDFANLVEWIGQAMRRIGTPMANVQKTEDLAVAGYEAALPCDYLAAIRTELLTSGSSAIPYAVGADQIDPYMDVKGRETSKPLSWAFGEGKIITSFESGTLRLQYVALDLDDEGFPRVPQDDLVFEAIKWFVARNMRGHGHTFPAPELNSYDKLHAFWLEYAGRARNALRMPDEEGMQRMANINNYGILGEELYYSRWAELGSRESINYQGWPSYLKQSRFPRG